MYFPISDAMFFLIFAGRCKLWLMILMSIGIIAESTPLASALDRMLFHIFLLMFCPWATDVFSTDITTPRVLRPAKCGKRNLNCLSKQTRWLWTGDDERGNNRFDYLVPSINGLQSEFTPANERSLYCPCGNEHT